MLEFVLFSCMFVSNCVVANSPAILVISFMIFKWGGWRFKDTKFRSNGGLHQSSSFNDFFPKNTLILSNLGDSVPLSNLGGRNPPELKDER